MSHPKLEMKDMGELLKCPWHFLEDRVLVRQFISNFPELQWVKGQQTTFFQLKYSNRWRKVDADSRQESVARDQMT